MDEGGMFKPEEGRRGYATPQEVGLASWASIRADVVIEQVKEVSPQEVHVTLRIDDRATDTTICVLIDGLWWEFGSYGVA